MTINLTIASRIRLYQARVLLKAMELYLDKGIRVHTAYTPRNMRQTAGSIIGQPCSTLKIARGKLKNWIDANDSERS